MDGPKPQENATSPAAPGNVMAANAQVAGNAPQMPEPPTFRLRLPRREELEMFGVVIQLHGSNQVKVLCEDGKERGCRIPGKMKKKTWLRERDIVIIKLWSFQPTKADVVWRFLGMQVENLRRRGYLRNLPV